MEEDVKNIVEAIVSLRQKSNVFKDYMFPIVSSFFSALLGAGVAFITVRHQENIQLEKHKMIMANKWIILVQNAFATLITLKTNYYQGLSKNTFHRAITVPAIRYIRKPIQEEVSGLSFIVPKEDVSDLVDTKWRQLPRIHAMIENYNFILDIWDERNKIVTPIKEKIMEDYATKAFVDVNQDLVIQSVGTIKYSGLVEITERCIKLTDDLIIELYDFLQNFPEIAKSLIQTKTLKRYGTVLTYVIEENSTASEILVRMPEVDYEALSELFGKPADEIRSDFHNGYG